MANGIGGRTVLFVPNARSPVQRPELIGMFLPQTRLEYVCKQVVIAVPVASIIERHDK